MAVGLAQSGFSALSSKKTVMLLVRAVGALRSRQMLRILVLMLRTRTTGLTLSHDLFAVV